MKQPTKAFVYAFSLAAITYAGWQLEPVSPTVSASAPGVCCTGGADCQGTSVCCTPKNSLACSQDKPKYCVGGQGQCE